LRFDEALPTSALSFAARAPLTEAGIPVRGFFTVTEFEQLERNNLVAALETASWKVSGSDGAAAMLGLKPSTLASRLKALDVTRPESGSLYVRLGGNPGIAALARDLFGRVLSDPQLGRFWEHRSTIGVLREEQYLVAFLSSVYGGPAQYIGRDMEAAHHELGITAEDWEVFRAHLRETLAALCVSDAEAREVLDSAESLKDDIVGH
jgi:hemoglobin